MIRNFFILLLLLFPAISFHAQNPVPRDTATVKTSTDPPVEIVGGSIKHKKSEGKWQKQNYRMNDKYGGILLVTSLAMIGIVLLNSWYRSRKKRRSN